MLNAYEYGCLFYNEVCDLTMKEIGPNRLEWQTQVYKIENIIATKVLKTLKKEQLRLPKLRALWCLSEKSMQTLIVDQTSIVSKFNIASKSTSGGPPIVGNSCNEVMCYL